MVISMRVSRRDTTHVFLSNARVAAAEAPKIVPVGFRLATLEELSLRYEFNSDFRRELFRKGPAWISPNALNDFGCNEIEKSGKHVAVSYYRFLRLNHGQRSFHDVGNGNVFVGVTNRGGLKWLSVDVEKALSDTKRLLRAAYVGSGEENAAQQNTNIGAINSENLLPNAAKGALRE